MQEDQLSRLACDRCYRRKARCDKVLPTCSTCIHAGVSCCYTTRNGLDCNQEAQSLARRLRQLENKNRILSRQLRESQQNARASVGTASGNASDAAPETMEMSEHNYDLGDKSETENDNDNEVAKQVYSLSLHAGRTRQYLGSASGAILANLLGIDKPPGRPHGENNDDEDSFSRFASTSGQKYSGAESAKIVLPSEPLARNLLAAYLSHDHLAFPYLYPKRLINTLHLMYSEQKFYETHPVDAFTMDMIFAIATVQVHRFSWQSLPDAEIHHERAISKLGVVLESGGLVALQTLMLLCQYRLLSVAYNTSASLWHLLGMATRIGIALGLHREAVYQVPFGLSSTDESALRQELGIKRRCFWSLFQMDRIVSNTLGRPVSISLLEIDTEYPTVEDDAETSLSPSSSVEDILQYPHWPVNTRIFNHITWHRVIMGKILSELHNVPKSRIPEPQTSIAIKTRLAEELDQWRAGVASLPLVDVAVARSKDKSNYRTHEWYNLLYHNCILMLHRPIHSLQELPQTSVVLTQIYHSAQQSIFSYAELHKARKINYTWITLHSVFLVGLSYVYALRTHFQNKRRQLRASIGGLSLTSQAQLISEPTFGQCVSDMRRCSTVLVAISERWNTGRGCHEIFARLSDAVLVEASECSAGTTSHDVSLSGQHGLRKTQTMSGGIPLQLSPEPLPMDFGLIDQDYYEEFHELFGDQYNNNGLLPLPANYNL